MQRPRDPLFAPVPAERIVGAVHVGPTERVSDVGHAQRQVGALAAKGLAHDCSPSRFGSIEAAVTGLCLGDRHD